MGSADQKQFTDAVAKAKAAGHIDFMGDPSATGDPWVAAVNLCNRLAMFDMLPALKAISTNNAVDLEFLTAVEVNRNLIGDKSTQRIMFAVTVVERLEIEDRGLDIAQVNDGREFLGCTRLDNAAVQHIIDDTLNKARILIAADKTADQCCGAYAKAWAGKLPNHPTEYDPNCLVAQRRAYKNASLNSNLAAAAHYMLARYHVCSAKAAPWQMNTVIDGYDEKKRIAIGKGDRDLKTIALTSDNRPFPPDFAIRGWAQTGAADGAVDRTRCNSSASAPLLFPNINGSEL
jgi:hypothetical protein